MTSAADNRQGAVLMLVAMACYVANDTFVKLASDRLPPGQILALRGVFATMLVLALAAGSIRGWRECLRPIAGVRCGLEIAAALASVAALSLAPLATVTSLMMTAPLLIAVSAMALRWEPWRARRVLAAGIGFAGALLVIRPSATIEVPTAGVVCAVLCAVLLAARDMVTRRLPASISSETIAVATTLAVALAGGLLGLAEGWSRPTHGELVALAGAAAFAATGNYALVRACRGVDLSVVTPFRYSSVVWALLLGHLVWGEVPDPYALGGIVLIAAGGAYAAWTSYSGSRRPTS